VLIKWLWMVISTSLMEKFARSAPNYCYRSGNLASILQLDESLNRHFEVFNEEAAENRTFPSSQSVRYML